MCNDCEWLDYIDLADDMLLDEEYDFASDTIEGIKDWIKENEHVTDNQKNALQNIYKSAE